MKKIFLLFLIFSSLFGQVKKEEARQTVKLGKVKLDKYFEGYDAGFLMLDLNKNEYIKYNDKKTEERLSPCSTFKIANSLIGLETGVIKDTSFIIKWDGKKRPMEAWNKDHTLRTAFENSVVPYYQELARRVGKKKMKAFLKKLHYGNEDISGGIDKFWLMSSLKISASEQVGFLKKLYKNELPFSKRSTDMVKDIMVYLKTDKATLRGKTGSSGAVDGNFLGWYTGYLTTKDNTYIFALNLESKNPDTNGPKARDIIISMLKDMQLL